MTDRETLMMPQGVLAGISRNMSMGEKSIPYEDDLQDWLQTPEHAAEYLTAILEENDIDALLLALRDVAKAQGGMAAVAERTQIRRETLLQDAFRQGQPGFQRGRQHSAWHGAETECHGGKGGVTNFPRCRR